MVTDTKRLLYALLKDIDERDLPAAQAFLEFLRARREAGAQLVLLEEGAPAAPPLRDVGTPHSDMTDDPVLQALEAAPIDDEPEDWDEAAEGREARFAITRGEVVSNEELRREIGW